MNIKYIDKEIELLNDKLTQIDNYIENLGWSSYFENQRQQIRSQIVIHEQLKLKYLLSE